MISKPLFLLFSGFFFCLSTLSIQAQSPAHLKYIDEYKEIAIREMERAGIPASIKLAQGILESNAGQSYLARRANNHFGIKCGDNWNGKTVHRKDDDYNAQGKLVESCFRSYRSVEASYVAHSEFLRDPRKNYRYGFLFQLEPTDYRRWAYGLKKAGYATSATYPEKLIDIIDRYQLFQYDRMSTINLDTPGSELIAGVIMQTNDVKYTLATPEETLAEIAERTDIALRKLINYNEHLSKGNQVLNDGEKVYLQKKRKSYRGRQKYHTVSTGESMIDIANLYGIRLDKLYKRNRMDLGQEPAQGEKVKLRGGKAKSAPKLRRPGEVIPPPDPIVVKDDDNLLELDEETENNTGLPTVPKPDEDTVLTQPKPPVIRPPVVTAPPATGTDDPFGQDDKINPPAPGDQEPLPPPVVITRPPVKDRPAPPPVVTDPGPTRPAPPTTKPSPSVSYHTVVKGDTLWNISQRYNLTVGQLKQLNGLNSNIISIGQQLRVE